MDKKHLIIYNGEKIDASKPVITTENRAFRYGDGLFETIRVVDGSVHLIDIHYKRLMAGCENLKFKVAKEYTEKYFNDLIIDLCSEKKISDNARVRLSFFRTEGGYYAPTSNKAEFIIEAEDMKVKGYPLKPEGLKVDLYTALEKPTNLFSTYKTSNSLMYVLASIYKKEHGLDDCFLMNSKSRIVETIDSNIFIVKNGEISTPPTTEGCIGGVMREYIISVMENNGIRYTKTPISIEDLFTADEIFVTNAIIGVQFVKSYKTKEYQLGVAKILSDHINKELIKK
jgi:branched-chain amino acid aminotransferase